MKSRFFILLSLLLLFNPVRVGDIDKFGFNLLDPHLRLNMEMQYSDIPYCAGEQVVIQIITRYNVGFDGVTELCNLNNGFSYLFFDINYNFVIELVDDGNPSNNVTYNKSHALTDSYITNNTSPGTAVDLGDGFSIYFDDTNWEYPTSTAVGDDTIYVNPNYHPFIGECDSDAPRRPDIPTGAQPNWISYLVFDVPSGFVGPGSISFANTTESGYSVVSSFILEQIFPGFGYQPPLFQTANVEGNIGPSGGTPPILEIGDPGDCAPLALWLIDFEAKRDLNNSRIKWSIVSDETFNVTVEHSTKGDEFYSLDITSYEGFLTDQVIEGSYTHTTPSPGFNYYRLKIIRENGSIEYSDVVSLEFDRDLRSESIKVYPNPVRDVVTIENGQRFSEVEVYNIQGQLLKRAECEETNRYQVGTADLEPGKYFIWITGVDVIETTSFVKL